MLVSEPKTHADGGPRQPLQWGAVIARPPLPPGPFLVVGLARSGVAAARALATRGRAGGRRRMPGRSPTTSARRCSAPGVEVRDGEDGRDVLEGIATVVKSPGVPREAPLVAAALRARDLA